MAYTLLSQSYGVANANLDVTILESGTGVPAIILASATGGLISTRGQTKLDASGNLSVYVDSAKTWLIKIDDGQANEVVVTSTNKFVTTTELANMTSGAAGVTYIVNTPPYDRYIWNGTQMVVQPTVSNSGTIIGSGGAPVSGGGIQQTKTEILRRIRQYGTYSPITDPYLVAPVAWSARTYMKGESVSSGGNYYICMRSGASATAPSGAVNTIIQPDGAGVGAAWYYRSAVSAAAQFNDGAVSYTTATAVPGGYTLVDFRSVAGFKKWADLEGAFMLSGTAGAHYHPTWGVYNTLNNDGVPGCCWSTMIDSPSVVLSAYYGDRHDIAVDGVRLTVGGVPSAAPTAWGYLVLTFPNARPRKITVYDNNLTAGIYLPSGFGYRAWRPDPATLQGAWIGDSYDSGAMPGPSLPSEAISVQIGRKLGLATLLNMSVGGTGFSQSGNSTIYNFAQRVAVNQTLIAASKLDFVGLSVSGNDMSTGISQYTADVTSTLQLLRELKPSALIFVRGPMPNMDSSLGIAEPYIAAVKSVISSLADPGVVYLPTMAADSPDGVAWMNNANSALYINAYNGDIHPLDSGARYYADRTIRSIAEACAA